MHVVGVCAHRGETVYVDELGRQSKLSSTTPCTHTYSGFAPLYELLCFCAAHKPIRPATVSLASTAVGLTISLECDRTETFNNKYLLYSSVTETYQ